MTSDYVPETEEVRWDATFYDGMGGPITVAGFDTWLRKIKSEAWQEGFRDGNSMVEGSSPDDSWNPYQ